jgi:hypothetical protein
VVVTTPAAHTVLPYGSPVRLDNRCAWVLALSPLAFLAGEAVLGATELSSSLYRPLMYVWLSLVACSLVVRDTRRLCHAGIGLGRLACLALVVPLYLLARTAYARRSYHLPIVWCVAFAMTLPSVGILQRTLGVRLKGDVVERVMERNIDYGTIFEGVRVNCPGHPRVKVGHAFRCTVIGTGEPAYVTARLVDGEGRFAWDLVLDGAGGPQRALGCTPVRCEAHAVCVGGPCPPR